MVADSLRDTAAAAALDTIVLNRLLVRSRGDRERGAVEKGIRILKLPRLIEQLIKNYCIRFQN